MLDIVIVNWNSGHFLRSSIQSIIENPCFDEVGSVIIIDNHSTDGSLTQVPEHTKIQRIVNDRNRGFAYACNQGFRLCRSTYVLLLNPDACLLPDTLGDSLQYMESHPQTAILGCRLLDESGNTTHSCSRFPSPLRIFFDAAGLSKIAPRWFLPATIMTDWDHAGSRFVPQVMGAFMFMRTTLFAKFGYFDERFFVYFEEVDFCKRITDAGEKVFYNHLITAIHAGEGTTSSVKAFRLYLSLRSRMQYARKHFRWPGVWLVACCNYMIEPISRTGYLLVSGKAREIPAVWAAMRMLINPPLLH